MLVWLRCICLVLPVKSTVVIVLSFLLHDRKSFLEEMFPSRKQSIDIKSYDAAHLPVGSLAVTLDSVCACFLIIQASQALRNVGSIASLSTNTPARTNGCVLMSIQLVAQRILE